MSGILLDAKRKHPKNKKLSEALAEDAENIKARKGLIDKTATLVKATDDGDADAGTGATMRPTDEQLERINGFTKRPVTADEVVAFKTLSCNDIVDRDDDQFSTQCVKDFAALEQPFSPTGKSFMLDHAYSVGNAVGRIFGTDTEKLSGSLFLTNEVYMPNTPQFEPHIEKIDFGISWAVSVGVMLGKDECSVCKEPFSYWGYWCRNGHDKGLYYDPDSDETDDYGYPLPVDPGTKGAVKCVRIFSEPKDMYELSQVFLGAQYFAALEREPDFAAVMKSVKDPKVPIVGLSREEVKSLDLPIPHLPDKLAEARKKGLKISETDDGSLVWTDSEGLRWTFDPEAPEDGVLGLGKASTDATDEDGEEEDDGNATGIEADGDGQRAVDGSQAPESDAAAGLGGSGDSGDHAEAGGELERSVEDASGSGASVDADADEDEDSEDSEDEEDDDESSSDEDNTDDNEEEDVDKAALVALAKKAKLPKSVLDAVEGADDGEAIHVLLNAAGREIKGLRKEKDALVGKAELGDQYLKELRSDAIDWFIRANQTKDKQKVSTDIFERLLDKCGDDVDLIKDMIEQERADAQAKFPGIRRSSFPSDPHERGLDTAPETFGEDEEGGSDSDERVKRIHG